MLTCVYLQMHFFFFLPTDDIKFWDGLFGGTCKEELTGDGLEMKTTLWYLEALTLFSLAYPIQITHLNSDKHRVCLLHQFLLLSKKSFQ